MPNHIVLGEPGGFVIQIIRSCDGRIARCGVGQIVSGDLIKIGVAASLAKVKQLAERHAAEQRS